MTDPLQGPLDGVEAGIPVDVLQREEIVAAEICHILLENEVEYTVVELGQPVNDLCALVNDVLVEILRLSRQLSKHLEGLL